MKLIELLLERLTAGVYVNSDKKLHVIASLVKETFGPRFDKITGGCLAAQMIYSMSAAADVEPDVLVNALNKSKVTAGYAGTTLENLYKVFHNKPIKVGDETLTFKLSVDTPTLEGAIKEVKSGQPVIFIPSSVLQNRFDDHDDKGIADITDRDLQYDLRSQSTYHAYLMIGYDAAGYIILREMRSTYAFKGYVKAPIRALKKNPKAYHCITIIVDDVKREKA